MSSLLNNNRGLTLIELVVTMVILGILGSMVLPSLHLANKRAKEIELKQDLREIRTAIDNYKKYYDKAVQDGKLQSVLNESGYPKTLQELVDGYDFGGLVNYKIKFLRRIPMDPFHKVTGDEPRWRMRSFEDDPDSTSWGGEDVFDVSSLCEETAIDGTNYKDW
ncbi:MAG TPA: type II secretion system protein [Geomonas sp.]|nr:type II secretion system protein [Geomonas sp.]